MKDIIQEFYYRLVSTTLTTLAWIQCGRKYNSPVRHDRIIWISPDDITYKPVAKPPTNIFPKRLIVTGDWDQDLERIDDDIVFRSFHSRFIEDKSWNETGYLDFLTTDISEHGNISTKEAYERCKKMDELFECIKQTGYKSQTEIDRAGSPLDDQSWKWLPPEYREISVSVSRDGNFLWQTGMHRIAIAKLLSINQIPVRINARHERWQQIRNDVSEGGVHRQYAGHPDLTYLK